MTGTTARQRLGQAAEDFAAARLSAAGWRVLERNARTRFGELDVVALDRNALVFVEVKAGRIGAGAGPERPILSIGPRKQQRIRRLATAWMAANRTAPPYRNIRFDAIGITFDAAGGVADYEHIVGAF